MVAFNDLKPAHSLLKQEIEEAVQRVIHRGWYILGPEVEAFETAFASYHDLPYAIGVANGTDAIELALRSAHIGPGDEVITVSLTAVPTVCAIESAGATPVLVDIDSKTYTIDPKAVEAALSPRTKAILPVHLYGQAADMTSIMQLAGAYNLLVVEDCAQAHGARHAGKLVGTFGNLAAFSFYPTKNLGAYGDGGMILTRDPHYAESLRRLRNYGQVTRYEHLERGVNSRLDEIQAAILGVKLQHLDEFNRQRRWIAGQYADQLVGLTLPFEHPSSYHVYHLYVIRHPSRDILRKALSSRGIDTFIHYPVPVHLQKAYADLGYSRGSLPVTERIVDEICSLPLYIGLGDWEITEVAGAIAASMIEIGV